MADPQLENQRQQAKRETRRALVAAAREVFAEAGLHGASLDLICARAGFTRGAFYVHFTSREDLTAAVMEEILAEIMAASFATDLDDDLEGTIGRYLTFIRAPQGAAPEIPFHQFLEACRESPALATRFNELLDEARRRVRESVHAAQQSGRVDRGVNAEELARLLVIGALGAVVADQIGMPYEPTALRDVLLRVLSIGKD